MATARRSNDAVRRPATLLASLGADILEQFRHIQEEPDHFGSRANKDNGQDDNESERAATQQGDPESAGTWLALVGCGDEHSQPPENAEHDVDPGDDHKYGCHRT